MLSWVSIPAWFDWRHLHKTRLAVGLHGFNTSLVRLARPGPLGWRCPGLCFNTSLVRLAPGQAASLLITLDVFQYQLGSIGAMEVPDHLCYPVQFQYQLGSIGARSPEKKGSPQLMFQYQLGSIGA